MSSDAEVSSSEASGESAPSNDSGIGLNPATQQSDSDTEMINLGDGGVEATEEIVIAESDIDTESDFETDTSDTDLLIKTTGSQLQKPSPQQRILNCLNPLPLFLKIKDRFTDCFSSIVACVTCVAGCKLCMGCSSGGQKCSLHSVRRGAVCRLKKIGSKLLQTGLLFKDRRVLLSTLLYGLASFIFIIQNEVLLSL